MKKKLFFFIIIINSLALVGVILAQAFWVRQVYKLHEIQLDAAIKVALKGATNQLLDYHLHLPDHNDTIQSLADFKEIKFDANRVDPIQLDLLIKEELISMNIGDKYEYAIIDQQNDIIIMGNIKGDQSRVRSSIHQINMTGFKNAESTVLSLYIPHERSYILKRIVTWLIISVFFTILITAALFITLSFVLRQKRLSEIKADFINNMTHEFKTPLATISLASEMLMKRSIQDDPHKMHRYAQIIFDENSRLQNHIEQILRVSMLEKGKFKLRKKETDLHELLTKIVDTFELTVKERHGELKSHYCAKKYIMMVDPVHITNAITNLLDNANKYSTEPPRIKIGTYNDDEGIVISVEDKGMGIDMEHQRHIFKNLYRVPTGNIYNRDKGFGIGLYYVKTIIEAHGGHIKLKSELGKGSRFDLYLPFLSKSTDDHEEYSKT